MTDAASDTLVKHYDTKGAVRYMTRDEIKDRVDLNVANTASAMRARVVAELAKANGHHPSNP